MKPVRRYAALVFLTCACIGVHAQAITGPLDAIGNIRSSLGPYVAPATRLATLFIDGGHIDCQAAVPTKWLDVKEFQNANDATIRKSPGLVHVSDLTVSGTVSQMMPVLSWFDQLTGGVTPGFRKNLKLEVYTLDGTLEVAEFDLRRCWPRQVNYSHHDEETVTIQIVVETMDRLVP